MGYTMLARHGYQTLGKRKESLAKYQFTNAGYTLLGSIFLADHKGRYLTGSQLKSKLTNCPGHSKTPTTDDVAFICDNLMGIDFFIELDNEIIGIDCTIISNELGLLKKYQKAKRRIQDIQKHKLGLKYIDTKTGKCMFKPITKILVYSFDPNNFNTFNQTHMSIILKHMHLSNIFKHS